MATVGKMVAVLSARTQSFQKGMKRSANAARRLGRAVRGAAGFVAKLGALAGAAALGGLALLVKSQLKSIDTLAKLSRNLGISIADLQSFRLAAEIAGVGQEKLDKGIKKLVKSLSDAGRGLSTQVDAFNALGLSMEDLQGLDPAEAFRKLADALKETGVTVQTQGALMDIFGAKIGLDMVELLRAGSEGLDSFKQEIEDMGLSLTKVDAAKVEAANDAWTRFKGILSGVAQKITVELAPFIEAAVAALSEMGKTGEGAGGFITTALEVVAKTIAFTANVVQRFALGFQALGFIAVKAFQLQLKGLTLVARGIEFLLDKVGILDAGWTRHFDAMDEKIQQIADGLKQGIGEKLDSIADGGWGKRITDKFDAIRKAAQAAAEKTVELEDANKPIPEVIEPAVKKVEELAEEIKQVVEPSLEMKEPRRQLAGEGDVALLGIGGKADKEAATQLEIKEILAKSLQLFENPRPLEMVWSS